MNDSTFRLDPGTTPLLISLPHVGTALPDDQRHRYVDRAAALEDTDWWLHEVYAFARRLGAGMIVPTYSRYLIDLNRPAGNAPMYPGANNTELCPTRFFTGDPLYRDGLAPDTHEIDRRRRLYWAPYRAALESELGRLRAVHGHAVLFDGHSIHSRLPWLFDGTLPDLNLGTVGGASCAPGLRAALVAVLAAQQQTFSHVVDGRFKGGDITRHHGRPDEGWHAVQLEMCWSTYMDEAPPWVVAPERLQRLQPVLAALVQTMSTWTPHAA